MRERVESENEKANGQTIQDLNDRKEKLERENELYRNRIDQLSVDYTNLHSEFDKYRNSKQD